MRLVTTKYQLICNSIFVLFWITATYNFITQEIAGGEVPAVELGVRLLAQGVIIILGLWTLRTRTDWIVIGAFCAVTLIGTLIVNKHGIVTWIDGMRLYVCFLFLPPILRYLLADPQYRAYFIARMDRTLYRFLLLQFPCIVWQHIRYVNFDLVGGSLGYMMSGVISNLIYLCSFYLMLRRWDKTKSYVENLMANWDLIFLLIPSFLNETKISLVFLLMYFFFLIPMDRQFIKRLVWIAPLMVLFFIGAFFLYVEITNNKDQVSDTATAATYLVGDEAALNMVEGVLERNDDFLNEDLARGLKFAITPAIMNRNPPSWAVGYGIGQYKVGDSAKNVEFAKRYQWLLGGTMIQGHVIWLEIGLIGVVLYFLYFPIMLKIGRHLTGRNLQLQWMLGLNALIFTIYNAPYFVIPFVIIFTYLLFISSQWNDLPPYKMPKVWGSRPVKWSINSQE